MCDEVEIPNDKSQNDGNREGHQNMELTMVTVGRRCADMGKSAHETLIVFQAPPSLGRAPIKLQCWHETRPKWVETPLEAADRASLQGALARSNDTTWKFAAFFEGPQSRQLGCPAEMNFIFKMLMVC